MDRDNLNRRRRQLEREQSSVKTEIQQLQDSLWILNSAYKSLKDEKARLDQVRTAASDAHGRVSYWKGNNYSAFTGEYNEMLTEYGAVYRQVDRILDNINWKRNDLNKRIASKQSILKGILSNWNSIITQLQNWTN